MIDFSKRILKIIPVRIFLPVMLTVILFVLTIFLLILPRFEDRLMDGKREVILELTESAWSILNVFEAKEKIGLLSREDAQTLAVEYLRHLRYGPELKDYFWINDMHPRIIMHPYRPDLEGKDITDFSDPKGKRLFVEFVKTVQAQKSGYVDYQWQWKDDPRRVVPKISYVKGFEPWGWIIGTGIYVEDVRAEIASFTHNLTIMCLGILIIIMGMSSYIIWHSMKVEREKKHAEEQTRIHQEQLFQAAKLASVGTLASGVAHEINNPLTSIMLNIPILEKIWERALPIIDEHCRVNGDFQVGGMSFTQIRDRIPLLLSNIADGTKRVKTIVSDLKDFARESPSEMKDDLNINHAVKKAVSLVSNLIKKSTNHFSGKYSENLPAVKGNSQRIEQVVINLLVNACEAIQDKLQPITISTEFDSDSSDVVIKIQDSGVGIPPETLKRIKDPFFTTKRNTGGTGLGLAISDKIIRDHGGYLEFISEPGKGTLAKICLAAVKQ